MTRSRGLRQRIVRIRAAEYRIAQLQLAEARRSASQISSIAGRIDALAFENRVTAVETKGASLAAISEMAIRLDTARQSTAVPMKQALLQIVHSKAISMKTHAKLEGANRLLEKSTRENLAHAEKRADADRCFRPHKAAGDLS